MNKPLFEKVKYNFKQIFHKPNRLKNWQWPFIFNIRPSIAISSLHFEVKLIFYDDIF